jgi:NTE family protein
MVGQVPIEKLKKTFGAVATDLNTGMPILFRRGNTGQAVRASSSVPGVFQPVKINERRYVDGGLVSPVPVRFAREMGADIVIAVNISSTPDSQAASSSLEVLMQTFTIMGQSLNQFELKNADVVFVCDRLFFFFSCIIDATRAVEAFFPIINIHTFNPDFPASRR